MTQATLDELQNSNFQSCMLANLITFFSVTWSDDSPNAEGRAQKEGESRAKALLADAATSG